MPIPADEVSCCSHIPLFGAFVNVVASLITGKTNIDLYTICTIWCDLLLAVLVRTQRTEN